MKYQAFTLTANSGLLNAIYTDIQVMAEGKQAQIRAVWDSGATTTCISKNVAEKLGLKPIGISRHHTAAGIVDCNDYIIDILLPNRIVIGGVRVSDFDGNDGLGALIGMDIITIGDFSITNAGKRTVVSFRVPSE